MGQVHVVEYCEGCDERIQSTALKGGGFRRTCDCGVQVLLPPPEPPPFWAATLADFERYAEEYKVWKAQSGWQRQ